MTAGPAEERGDLARTSSCSHPIFRTCGGGSRFLDRSVLPWASLSFRAGRKPLTGEVPPAQSLRFSCGTGKRVWPLNNTRGGRSLIWCRAWQREQLPIPPAAQSRSVSSPSSWAPPLLKLGQAASRARQPHSSSRTPPECETCRSDRDTAAPAAPRGRKRAAALVVWVS